MAVERPWIENEALSVLVPTDTTPFWLTPPTKKDGVVLPVLATMNAVGRLPISTASFAYEVVVPIPTVPAGEFVVEILTIGTFVLDVAIDHAFATPFGIVVVEETVFAKRPPDAVIVPDTLNALATVDDAEEMKPPVRLRSEEKTLLPEKVLLSVRRVELAAVTVIVPPRLKLVPLMVPKTPVMRLEPMEEVETTLPVLSTPRSELVRFGRKRF